MREVRLAATGEIERQKDIWRRCFGDSGPYIEDFYLNRYHPDQTMLLLQDGQIIAMLTMLPVGIVTAAGRLVEGAMLYAIATHPDHQNRGAGRQLIESAHQHLQGCGLTFSLLVPAYEELFEFYRPLGYREACPLREVYVQRSDLYLLPAAPNSTCLITPISPAEYNQRRERLLAGHPHVSYALRDIVIQQNLARLSGQDIYGISLHGFEGCAVVEKGLGSHLFVKELLMAAELIPETIEHLRRLSLGQSATVRMPAFSGEGCGGEIRPFGMIKLIAETDLDIADLDTAFLGLAFD
jgi:GNAT superfamily N-acetyltransferase